MINRRKYQVKTALLCVDEMYRADALAVAGGTASLDLMEAAGRAVVDAITGRWQMREVSVLCGPGNNGGDGFVIARLLTEAGWPVRVALLGEIDNLRGDALINAKLCKCPVTSLNSDILSGHPLVVDALFGAGLKRPVDGVAADVIDAINSRALDCVAVDMASGVVGDTGAVIGCAPRCRLTVTFFRPKPGHYLLPGCKLRGDLVIADIGIPDRVLADIKPDIFLNDPALWLDDVPWPTPEGNKYSRGHAVIAGGGVMTGAARLAAGGARRAGAGLVSVWVSPEVFPVYAIALPPGVLVRPGESTEQFSDFIADNRITAVLVGPGAGISEDTRDLVMASLAARDTAVVLDADALSAFRDDPQMLMDAISGPCLLTPHDGEFSRIFDAEGDKVSRVRAAAHQSGAVVLLKGFDTVIADQAGRVVINANAPPDLATAGAGDVLAGVALGLLAGGMNGFAAASAAVWINGEAARRFGPGLVAEDIAEGIPAILDDLRKMS